MTENKVAAIVLLLVVLMFIVLASGCVRPILPQ
jgi:hypothetical protein